MKNRQAVLGCAMLAVLWTVFPAFNFLWAQSGSPAAQPAPAEKKVASAAPATAAPAPAGKEIKGGPLNPKERMGINVFMAWLWVAIIVLIFIFAAKIREVDRLYEARYFQDEKHTHSG